MSSEPQSNAKNLQILGILFEKSINSNEFDLLLADIICKLLLEEDPKLIDNLYELFAKEINSKNVTHVRLSRTLELLAECMQGEFFRDKILEEKLLLIFYNIILKKIDEKDIKNKLKNKFIEYILLWKIIYPNINDFKKLYDKIILKINKKLNSKQIDSETCKTDGFQKSNFRYLEKFDNVEVSFNRRNSIDLKSANIVIQYHLNQNKRGQILLEAQKIRLDELKKDIKDLNEMIIKKNRSSDNIKFMKEIYKHCSLINLIFEKLPIFVDIENDKQTENEEDIVLLRDEAIKISDDLHEVIKNYESLHISDDDFDENEEREQEKQDELNDFSLLEIEKETNTSHNEIRNSSVNETLFDNLISLSEIPLKPLPLYQHQHGQHKNENSIQIQNEKLENPSQKLDKSKDQNDFFCCIEKKTEEYFKQHLKDGRRIGKFEKKKPEKISLNEMKCNKTLLTTAANDDTFSSDEEEKLGDDEHETKLINISVDPDSIELDPNISKRKIKGHKRSTNDNIHIYFEFTKNRPKKNISVIRLSIINHGPLFIADIHLEAASEKPCKLRLLKPDKTLLPGVLPHKKPICDIKQILLYNPTKQPANVTFILSYKNINDDDKINESVTAIIPYIE